jgi:tRNA wybutosine-synthesizing protein 1
LIGESLRLLKAKRQRTVCRLTIVKGHNSGDIDGYADLICLGLPSIVEIKGVTFCGT